jgi:hypothetical protein
LELGESPTPDPVLKPRLDKVGRQLAEMALRVSSRLPGLKRFALSGFLAQTALGQVVLQNLKKLAPGLRYTDPAFPPEVGSALIALAQGHENREREHLGKPPFSQDRTVDEWTPPKVLIRRLYRTRKPFEDYVS